MPSPTKNPPGAWTDGCVRSDSVFYTLDTRKWNRNKPRLLGAPASEKSTYGISSPEARNPFEQTVQSKPRRTSFSETVWSIEGKSVEDKGCQTPEHGTSFRDPVYVSDNSIQSAKRSLEADSTERSSKRLKKQNQNKMVAVNLKNIREGCNSWRPKPGDQGVFIPVGAEERIHSPLYEESNEDKEKDTDKDKDKDRNNGSNVDKDKDDDEVNAEDGVNKENASDDENEDDIDGDENNDKEELNGSINERRYSLRSLSLTNFPNAQKLCESSTSGSSQVGLIS